MKKILFFIVLCGISAITPAQSKHLTQNVVLVTIDGLRWQEVFNGADSVFFQNKKLVDDASGCKKKYGSNDRTIRRTKLMPFIWNTVAKEGQIYGNRTNGSYVNVKNPYWFSYPGYNELLTGFADPKLNSNEYGPNPNTSLFEAMNKTADFRGKIAAFASWNTFNDILNEKRSGIYVSSGIEKVNIIKSPKMELLNDLQSQLPDIFHGVRLDGVTFQMGFEYLKLKQPRILYLAFDETDDFAHGGRYEDYLNSAHYTDGFLSTLWSWIQGQPAYKNKTTMIITCDHGRGNDAEGWRSHGTKTAGSDQTWFAIIGPDTKATGEATSGQFYNNQIAKTIGTLLDFNYQTTNPTGDAIMEISNKTIK